MKTALVIGGSSGVGLEISIRLVNEGFACFCFARRESPYRLVESITGDIRTYDLLSLIKSVSEKGELTRIYYLPAFSYAMPLEQITDELISELFDVNLFGAIRLLRAVKQLNLKSEIVFISSVASSIPIMFDPYYSASKAALEAFVFTASLEMENTIRVIKPAGIKTNFTYKRLIFSNECAILSAKRLALSEQVGSSPAAVAKKALIAKERSEQIQYVRRYHKWFTKGSALLPYKIRKTLIRLFFQLDGRDLSRSNINNLNETHEKSVYD